VAKDKKKKKKDKKGKAAPIRSAGKATRSAGKTTRSAGKATGSAGKAVKGLKALSKNPFVADVVAAALVGAAAALKDTKKARRLASEAGDEIEKMSRKGIQQGEALWDMALNIGRRSLEALSSEVAPKRAKPKPAAKPSAAKRRVARKSSR
jgi:hypothetical protein